MESKQCCCSTGQGRKCWAVQARAGKRGWQGTAVLSSKTMVLARNAEYVDLEGKSLHRAIEWGWSELSTTLWLMDREIERSGKRKARVTLQSAPFWKDSRTTGVQKQCSFCPHQADIAKQTPHTGWEKQSPTMPEQTLACTKKRNSTLILGSYKCNKLGKGSESRVVTMLPSVRLATKSLDI